MAVLIEALNVIIKVSVLEKKYPGGVQAYTSDCPNKTFCTDGRLTRVGFMCPEDVDSFLQRLELQGLQTTDSAGCPDVVVVDQHAAAPAAPCRWIAVGRFNDSVIGAWSIDPDDVPGELYVPRSWKFEGSLSENPGYVSSEERAERFVFDGFDGRNDVFIDLETGKKVYVGRVIADKNPMPAPTPDTDEELSPIRASMVWAEAVNTLDPSVAADLLADNLEVSFQWSFDDITGRDAYLEYWRDKFSQVDPDGPRTHAEFALTSAYTLPGQRASPVPRPPPRQQARRHGDPYRQGQQNRPGRLLPYPAARQLRTLRLLPRTCHARRRFEPARLGNPSPLQR